jgi:hypothetical protein
VVAVWGATYWAVCRHSGILLPHDLPSLAATFRVPWAKRYLWVVVNVARDAFNLPSAAAPWRTIGTVCLGGVAAGAVAAFARSARARARLGAAWPWSAWGVAWFLGAAATLPDLYPGWAPYRGIFAAVGLGVAVTALLGAAHPALLAVVVGIRLVTLGAYPGPPAVITVAPTDSGVVLDFAMLSRLELTLRETRTVLTAGFPTLPSGARVCRHYLPRLADYAFVGDKALQVWYRDTTLRWVSFSEFRDHPDAAVATIVEYQLGMRPQAALVNPAALRALLVADTTIRRGAVLDALPQLAAAERLQPDPGARVFLSTVAGRRSVCQAAMGRLEDAEREASRALALWADNQDAGHVLPLLLAQRGRLDEAEARLDTLLARHPDDRDALELRARVRDARARAGSSRPPR